MKQEFTFEGSKKIPYTLHGMIWLPEDREVKCMVQICHGMTEHIGRYEAFAKAMTDHGIAVAGFDLRGHGKNAGDAACASFGEGGWQCAIEDMHLFSEMMKEKYPNAKQYMLGFSLGSFLLREYLMQYDHSHVDGVVIMGTGHQPAPLLNMLLAVLKGEIKKVGWDQTTPLVQNLSFGTYNKKFKPNRTHSDWLCADEAELDAYNADAFCRKDISAGLFSDLLGSMVRAGDKKAFEKYRKDLPVLFISGKEDAVGDFGKGVQTLYKLMKKQGMKDVSLQMYEKARHDVLHEEASGVTEQARDYMIQWILKH